MTDTSHAKIEYQKVVIFAGRMQYNGIYIDGSYIETMFPYSVLIDDDYFPNRSLVEDINDWSKDNLVLGSYAIVNKNIKGDSKKSHFADIRSGIYWFTSNREDMTQFILTWGHQLPC